MCLDLTVTFESRSFLVMRPFDDLWMNRRKSLASTKLGAGVFLRSTVAEIVAKSGASAFFRACAFFQACSFFFKL